MKNEIDYGWRDFFKTNDEIELIHNTFVLKDEKGDSLVYCPKKKLMARGDLNDPDFTSQLKKAGFFKATKKENNHLRLFSGFKALSLMLTRNCQLRCLYCYARAGENLDSDFSMSQNLAEDAVNYYLGQLKEKAIFIAFHGGGEPTMSPTIIKFVVAMVERLRGSKRAYYSIVSNGLIDQKLLNWMMRKKFNLTISADGPPDIQNRNRPLAGGHASSEIVEKTIQRLVYADYPFTVRITYAAQDSLSEIFEYFGGLGVKNINVEPLFPYGRDYPESPSAELSVDLSKLYEEYAESFLSALDVAKKLNIVVVNPDFSQLESGALYYCGAASGHTMVVTHDGKLSGCLEIVEAKDELMQQYGFGEWLPNKRSFKVNTQKILAMRQRITANIPECQNCFARYYCAGNCSVKAIRGGDNLMAINRYRCFFTKNILGAIIREIAHRNAV